jgi:hypothetical protein
VVRHDLVTRIVKAYNHRDAKLTEKRAAAKKATAVKTLPSNNEAGNNEAGDEGDDEAK